MTRRCATWCGRGCTEEEYQQAIRSSHALAKRMGKGWKPNVWENLGWHYAVVSPCRRLKVHPCGRSFTAYLGEPDCPGGRWAEHGSTPKAAVRNVLRVARREADVIAALVEGL